MVNEYVSLGLLVLHFQKFIKDPYTTTWGGFSKVTNFLKDALLLNHEAQERPRHEVAEILSEDVEGVTVSQEEPGFEMVTRVSGMRCIKNMHVLKPKGGVNRSQILAGTSVVSRNSCALVPDMGPRRSLQIFILFLWCVK